MRGLSLARIAAQAELLRLHHLLRRQAVRVVLGAAAALFLLATLAGLHVAGALALAEHVTTIQAVLIVAAVDAVLAIALGLLAARDAPSAVEREALQVRRAATDQLVETVVLTALLRRLVQVRSFREFLSLVATAVAAWVAGSRR